MGGLLKDLTQTKAIFSEFLPVQVPGDTTAQRAVSLPGGGDSLAEELSKTQTVMQER